MAWFDPDSLPSGSRCRQDLPEEQLDEPRCERKSAPTKLTPFHEAMKQALRAGATGPKPEHRNALASCTELKAQGSPVTTRFTAMCAHDLFAADFCIVDAAWGKGQRREERAGQQPARVAGGEPPAPGSLVKLNTWLAQRCRGLWQELRPPEHRDYRVAGMHEHEREHLPPMTLTFAAYVDKAARASSNCSVSVARNRDSVPCEYAGQMVGSRRP